MSLRTALLLGLSASAAIGQTSNPDLVFNNLEIIGVEYVDPYFEIAISYEILNIGNLLIDLDGPTPDYAKDNVGIQTYLTADPDLSGPVFAAGGSALMNPITLAPGESYRGIYYANTTQFADPSVLDMSMWVVLDILTSSVPGELDHNNRAFIQIPAPGAVGLLGALSVGCARRRR